MVPLLVCSLLLVQPPAKPDDLQAALASHPDVQIAEAELRLAQAKLLKARLLVAQGVAAARAKVAAAEAAVPAAEAAIQRERANLERERANLARQDALRRGNSGVTSEAEVEEARRRVVVAEQGVALADQGLTAAKLLVAAARAELQALGAAPPGVKVTEVVHETVRAEAAPPRPAPLPAGPTLDKLRAALAAPVALDLPADSKMAAVCDVLAKALAPAGLTVRAPAHGPGDEVMTAGTPLKGQRPLREWLEVVADTFSNRTVPVVDSAVAGVGGKTHRSVVYVDVRRREFFVRDYGLLFAESKAAPAGAVTATEFVRRAADAEAAGKRAAVVRAEATGKPPSAEVLAKVKELMGKTVKLEPMNGGQASAFFAALTAAAGTDLAIRDQGTDADSFECVHPGGERSVSAWLQLVLDRYNTGRQEDLRVGLFVREYGLLLVRLDDPPPGAVPLAQVK